MLRAVGWAVFIAFMWLSAGLVAGLIVGPIIARQSEHDHLYQEAKPNGDTRKHRPTGSR